MHKQPEVTAATRARLMEAFLTLYREQSIDKISVSAIVAAAGVHRSTFYVYFQDVYDLLEQVERSMLEEMEQTVSQFTEQLPDGKDPVLQIASRLSEQFAPYAEKIYTLSRDPAFQGRMVEMLKPQMLRVSRISPELPNQIVLKRSTTMRKMLSFLLCLYSL